MRASTPQPKCVQAEDLLHVSSPAPPPPPQRLGQIFFQALGQSKIYLVPSAPIISDQTFSSAPLAPLETQHHRGGGVAVHSFLLVAYAGKTTLATTQRLRKHVTTALAGSEDSTFHSLLKKTTEMDWTMIPVELVDSLELACYRERDWWHTVRKYALNDAAPALPTTAQPVPGAQHTKQLQSTLRQAHVAHRNRDYAQTAIPNRHIQRIASSMNIPVCKLVNVTSPYLSSAQRTARQHHRSIGWYDTQSIPHGNGKQCRPTSALFLLLH